MATLLTVDAAELELRVLANYSDVTGQRKQAGQSTRRVDRPCLMICDPRLKHSTISYQGKVNVERSSHFLAVIHRRDLTHWPRGL